MLIRLLNLLLISVFLFAEDVPEQLKPFFQGYSLRSDEVELEFITRYPTSSLIGLDSIGKYDFLSPELPFEFKGSKYVDSNTEELIWNSIVQNTKLNFESEIEFYDRPLDKSATALMTRVSPVIIKKQSLFKQKLKINYLKKEASSLVATSIMFPQIGYWWKYSDSYVRLASATASDDLFNTGFSHLNLSGIITNTGSFKYRYVEEIEGLVPYVKTTAEGSKISFLHTETPVFGQQKFIKRKLYHLEYLNLDYFSADLRGDIFIDAESLLPVYVRSLNSESKNKYIVFILSSVNGLPFTAGGFAKKDAQTTAFFVRKINLIDLNEDVLKQFDPNLK